MSNEKESIDVRDKVHRELATIRAATIDRNAGEGPRFILFFLALISVGIALVYFVHTANAREASSQPNESPSQASEQELNRIIGKQEELAKALAAQEKAVRQVEVLERKIAKMEAHSQETSKLEARPPLIPEGWNQDFARLLETQKALATTISELRKEIEQMGSLEGISDDAQQVEGLQAKLRALGKELEDLQEGHHPNLADLAGAMQKRIIDGMTRLGVERLLGKPSWVKASTRDGLVEHVWRYEVEPSIAITFRARAGQSRPLVELPSFELIRIEGRSSSIVPDYVNGWRNLRLGSTYDDVVRVLGTPTHVVSKDDQSSTMVYSEKLKIGEAWGKVQLAVNGGGETTEVVGWEEPTTKNRASRPVKTSRGESGDENRDEVKPDEEPIEIGGIELWDRIELGDSASKVTKTLGHPWSIMQKSDGAQVWAYGPAWRKGKTVPDKLTPCVGFYKGQVSYITLPKGLKVWRRFPSRVIPNHNTWRKLSAGLSASEVLNILGEPESKRALGYNSTVYWSYSKTNGNTRLTFRSENGKRNGKSVLKQWVEPTLELSDMEALEKAATKD